MPYMPAVASLAAAHKEKIKNIRATALRETKEERNPGVIILGFEDQALAYDKQQMKELGQSGTTKLCTALVHVINLLDVKFIIFGFF